MKKRALFISTIILMVPFLQAMNYIAPELKIAWSYPLKKIDISTFQPHEREKFLSCRKQQRCTKKVCGITSEWTLQNQQYETCIATPLDPFGCEYRHHDFKAHAFIYNPEQCVAAVLRDRCKMKTGSSVEMWYIYEILHIINITHRLQGVQVRLLKKLPRFECSVVDAYSMPDGKSIFFFLEDGTTYIISPDEVQAPRIKGTRCEKLADLFFGFA
jgi:hypothetical protein